MDDTSLTSRLLSALPEELWAEVTRRLRAHPELWRAAHEPALLEAFLNSGTDLDQWRPGTLGLAALTASVPEAADAESAEGWLIASEAGKARLETAVTAVRTGSEEPDLIQSAAAAVAVRSLRDRQGGWSAVAREAAGPQAARWRLPLACLYSFVDEPASLIRSLFKNDVDPEAGAALASDVLLLNCTADEAVSLVHKLAGGLKPAQLLTFAHALVAAGAEDLAARISQGGGEEATPSAAEPSASIQRPEDLPRYVRQAAGEVERALVRRWAGDLESAKRGLAAALQSIQQLSGQISAAIGQVANEAGDYVTALAAYQTALADGAAGVDESALQGLMAQALVALGRPAEALAALSALPEPPPLAMAGVQHALDRGEEARQWAARASLAAPEPAPHPAVAAYHVALAKLLNDVGDAEAAVEAQKRVVACRPWDGAGQARLADMLWQARRHEAAHSAALQAMAFGPEAPRFSARKIVAQYLTQRGKHAAAVEHWKAALASSPDDTGLSLSLAASALAAGQLPLARDAAQATLNLPGAPGAKLPAARSHAEAHRILGEVAAAQGDDDVALQQFEQALSLDPALPTPWLAVAGHRRKSGDLAGALDVLVRAAKAAPKSAEIMAALAQLYDDLGRSSDAINALSRATDLAPTEAAYQRGLGLLLFRHRYLQGAIGAFRQAMQLAPEDAVSLHHLALSLVAEEGESESAYEIMQQAATLELEDPTPYRDLGRLALRLNHVDDALAALKTAVQRQGEAGDTGTLALLGEAYEAAGDHLNALDAYRQAVSLSPTRTDLNLRIGVCCLEAGQIEAAIASLLDAVEADGASVQAHRELGRAYAAAGMWSEAAMAFDYAATLAPDTAELHRMHGRASLQAAKSTGADAAHWHNRAVAALSQSAQLNAQRPDAGTLAELGLALSSVGRLEEARQAYDAALVLAPNSPTLRAEIAGLMTGFGEHARACDLLAEAAAIAPDDMSIAHAWAHSCLAARRHDAGHKAFARAAELAAKGMGKAADVKRAGYLRQAGECLWVLGRYVEAIGLWQKALEIDPGDSVTRARLGTALVQQGRHIEALAHLESVAAGAGGEVLLAAARAAIGAGRFDRAVVHLESAIVHSPEEAETHYLYGQALAAVNQPAQALEEFRRAASLDPRQGLYRAAIARALAAQGDTVEAVAAAQTALELSGNQPEVLAAAGEVFLTVEDYPRAAEVLERASEAQPNQAQSWMDLARALTLLVEAEAPLAEAKGSVPQSAGDDPRHTLASARTRALLNHALHRAAVLGASPNTVREWTGRARAFVGDAKEAIVLLESVAASPSSMPAERRTEIFRALGHAYRRDGAFDRARNALESAVASARQSDGAAKTRRLSPTGRIYPEALLELGQTALAQDDTAGALNAGRRAAAAAPRNPVYLHFLAEALLSVGDRREASSALERALALEPGVAHWHAQLAATLRARGPKSAPGDVAAVLEHLRAAAELEPSDAGYALDLARELADNGDLLAAANEYRRATDLSPDSAEAWREWGQLAMHIGGADMASECFDRALALAPSDAEALVGSAQAALAQGNLNEAQAKTNAALRLSPGNPAALACAAEVCAARGDTSGALEANAKAIAGSPAQADAVRLRLSRARFLRAAGRLNEAIASLETLANDEPEADEAYGMLGDALMVTKRFDEAMEQYRHALELAPDSATHLLRLGRACLEAGQLDQALAHLLQSRDLASEPAERADVEREIGKTFEARRQLDRALEAYREAINLNPNQPENFLRAAMAHKMLKQYQEAGLLFQRVVDLDPSNVEAHRQLVQVAAFELLQGAKLAAGMAPRN